MEARLNAITYQRSARYYTYGNPEKANTVLYALHGYGQLPAYFIRKFYQLDPDQYFVVCPEGPHRFYLQGTNGRVGASWMTKEDRLNDIQDYVLLLDTIQSEIETKHSFKKKILLGFSQGGATASRWLAYGKTKFNQFILWAAVFPPDMEPEVKEQFKASSNHMVIGNQDEYSTVEKAEEFCQKLNEEGMNFAFHTFIGKHDLDQQLLQKLVL